MKKIIFLAVLGFVACGPDSNPGEDVYCTGQTAFTICPLGSDGGCYAADDPGTTAAAIICSDATDIVEDCCDTNKIAYTAVVARCMNTNNAVECTQGIFPAINGSGLQSGIRNCEVVTTTEECNTIVVGNCEKIQKAGWCKSYSTNSGT